MKSIFISQGFVKNESFISHDEAMYLREIYDNLLKDDDKTKGFRSDLSGKKTDNQVEKITQIMRPSLLAPKLKESYTYKHALKTVKKLLGDDMELDFDMLINKAPNTNTETPWHQDAAYWIKMPDKRAVSIWIALDDVYEENGCMWFIPKNKNQEIIEHKAMPNGGALYCEVNNVNAIPIPLPIGGCTFHDGFTFHYSKGNITESQRRALILNFRSKKMIELERKMGVDHTGKREIRNKKGS
ncbi:MAG: phytanoyl-CoA dioxygenase family protein [Flavobacteriaceae bacterium]|nr:phytanoyl-CoA dioxygenase family protein [Flavobacteriaceae bacterium]